MFLGVVSNQEQFEAAIGVEGLLQPMVLARTVTVCHRPQPQPIPWIASYAASDASTAAEISDNGPDRTAFR